MIYHLNIVLIYIFCTLSLCRGRDGWRSQCQFRENLRTPPSHDNFPNKPKNKNTKVTKVAKPRPPKTISQTNRKTKIQKLLKMQNPALPENFPNKPKDQNTKIAEAVPHKLLFIRQNSSNIFRQNREILSLKKMTDKNTPNPLLNNVKKNCRTGRGRHP